MSNIELRSFVFLDSLQPQYAAFIGTTAQGFLPLAFDASLFVESGYGVTAGRPGGSVHGQAGVEHLPVTDSARVHVAYWGEWQRGTQVRVQVCYDVPPPPVPMGDTLSPGQICAYQIMPVNQLKSRW